MKRISFLSIIVLYNLCLFAQQLQVESFSLDATDLSASVNTREDANGDPCALLIVSIIDDNVKFSGNIVGDVTENGFEYFVFMTNGAKRLQVKHPLLPALNVNFQDYGINIKGKSTYRLILKTKEEISQEAKFLKALSYLSSKMYERAIPLLQLLSNDGNGLALCYLGNCYTNGDGVNIDLEKAFNCYKKSSEIGCAIAHFQLGQCYEKGRFVKVDFEKAASLYKLAAERGEPYSQFSLGYCYNYGNGVSKDLEKAVFWYKKAAEDGIAGAQLALGWCYEDGEGVPQDLKKAEYWMRKASAMGDSIAKDWLKEHNLSEE